ncbi:MAG: RAMP superfamily CRISPR-associated protein [Bradymonadaceae bacterium]
MIENATVIDATFVLSTPLFVANDAPSTARVFSLTAFKGALRYWWRALMWSEHEDLTSLRREEEHIFGSASHGPGAFSMHLVPPENLNLIDDALAVALKSRSSPEGLQYLGHGLWNRERLHRKRRRDEATLPLAKPCLANSPETEYLVRFLVHDRRSNDARLSSLCGAIKALGLMGGMGSRARRGFGSLTLTGLTVAGEVMYRPPQNMDSFTHEIGSLVSAGSRPAEYAAFDSRSRVIALAGEPGESSLELLDRLGRELLAYRSWGLRGMVLGRRSEKNFRDDHDLMNSVVRGRRTASHPRRVAFGLPHNYYFSSLKSGTSVAGESTERRASPLWLHIHRFDEHPPMAVLSFLPGTFLPPGEKLKVGRSRVDIGDKDFWKPVEDFLDRLVTGTGVEDFQEVREIC